MNRKEDKTKVCTDAANQANQANHTNHTLLNKKAFIDLFGSNRCNISKTCKKIGISRCTYYNWIETDPEFANDVEDAREELIDDVEDKLIALINKGDVPSTIFFLKTKGKKRGYVEKTETDTHVEIDGAKLLDKIQEDFNSGH